MKPLIEFQQVCKYYHMGDSTVVAADHISFEIFQGEFVAIVGSSGSGKSTCMNIIGCLDVPSEGTYRLNGQDVGQMNKNQLAEVRNRFLGFIFQQYNLLPKLNLVENVEIPLMYAGVSKKERRERARKALEDVGLYLNATGSGTSGTVFEQLVLPGTPVELGATVEVKFAENTEPDNGLSSANGDWAEDPEQKDQTQPQTGN